MRPIHGSGLCRVLNGIFQLDVHDQEASEVHSLIRSRENRLAPVNRLLPDVLALIPTERAKSAIASTHVWGAWREIFILRSPKGFVLYQRKLAEAAPSGDGQRPAKLLVSIIVDFGPLECSSVGSVFT